MKPNLIISAGGTGGHIFPALAIAKELESRFTIIWVGGSVGLENQIIPKYGYKLETVAIGGVRNKGIIRKLMLPIILLRACFSCFIILAKYRPKAVIGFGGYAAFPVAVMARLFNKPVIIHEQNSVAGLTNRILSRFAKCVLTAFPNVLSSPKTFVVGNPVRNEIIQAGIEKVKSSDHHGLRVLVIGGSLGAKVLNDYVPLALARSRHRFTGVLHQVGRGNAGVVMDLYQKYNLNAEVVTFIDDIAEAYKTADLVICRAGASTVTEISCAGVAAIFVPYPYAVDDHQTTNAKYLADNGAAILLPQKDLTPEYLASIIDELDTDKCNQIGQAARDMAISNSTEQICEHILRLV